MINDTKVFDRRDNTFLLSNRKIADRYKMGSSTVDRLFRVLGKHNLIKKVKNQLSNDKLVTMLSPKFLFISYTNSDRWITGALWELEDIKEVYKWSDLCKSLACFINPTTGEVKPFNWYDIECRADQYTCFDRCYRKHTKSLYIDNKEDKDSTQHYRLNELDSNQWNDQDYQWFNDINSHSDFDYPILTSHNFKVRSPLNIYGIKLNYSEEVTRCIREMIDSGLITAGR